MGHERLHASEHTDGTDDIQDATDSQKGLATASQISKLDGIDPGADVTGDNPPQAHKTTHQDGGTDEINVGDLSGELADPQKQKALAFGGDPLSTQQTSYTTFYHFIFPGTTKMGTPTAIKVLLAEAGSPTSVSVRIRDITNSNTIATQTGLTPSTYPNIDVQDMGSLSNLPSGEAIFLVEALRSGGGPGNQVVLSGGEVQW